MGFEYLATHCRLPSEDLWRTIILEKPERPDSQAILRVKSLRILPEPDLLCAGVVMHLRGPREERFSQLPAQEPPSEYRSAKIVWFVFLRPEVEFFLLINPGSRTESIPALQEGCNLHRFIVPGVFPQPNIQQLEFPGERVVKIAVNSQIALVLLLFQGEARIGVHFSENIEMIDGFLPDISTQERSRMQNRPAQLIGFDRFRSFQ